MNKESKNLNTPESIGEDVKAVTESKEKSAKAKKVKKQKNSNKLKNSNAVKKNSFMIIFTSVVAVLLIMINVLSVIIAQRLPTTIDLTTDKANTLTEENIEFIKGINEKVEIILCATREDYTGSGIVNYVAQSYYVYETATEDNYFNQTVNLIENYSKYNDNISVTFVDTQSPKFDLIKGESDISVSYGDILVRCTRKINGKETTSEKVLTFEDIYNLYDSSQSTSYYSGTSYYSITSSNIESELSSAIYTVAASQKETIAVLSGHSEDGAAEYLIDCLEDYNFETKEVDGIITAKNLENVDIVILAAPKSDLTAEELKILDDFLDNDGKKGKNFLTFGTTSSPETPNLNQFMEEWGIVVEDGMAYETADSNIFGSYMGVFANENDFVYDTKTNKTNYYIGGTVALSQGYETNNTRTSYVLMKTSENCVIAPKGTEEGYTAPASSEKAEMPVVIFTSDTVYDDNDNEISSYVGYFASTDFISSIWQMYGNVGNIDLTLSAINSICGRSDMYFLPKITGTSYMSVAESQITTSKWITIYILPSLILVGGVVVWIKRKLK